MRIKEILFILISGVLMFASVPLTVFAEENSNKDSGDFSTKDEVIYGKLDANGITKSMYVVNSFHITEPGEIMDYGDYANVRNLTDLTDIEQQGANDIRFQAEDEEFYYQGELDNAPLPWDISITYFLDGEEIAPRDLLGKSGELDIHIETSANESVDPVFFEYYLLQISLVFDPLIFDDIQAPKGTEANEGKNKLVTFTVLPEQEEEFIISTQVTNLEMDPIEIAATPANIGIDDPDVGEMKDEMKTLADAISDLHSGMADFQEGVADYKEGADELSQGSSEYQTGITELDQSSDELVGGSQQILEGLQEISAAIDDGSEMPDLGELEELPEGFYEMANDLRAFAELLDQLEEAIDNIEGIDQEEIVKVYKALENSDADQSVFKVLEQLEETHKIALTIKDINKKIPGDLAEIVRNMADQLDRIAKGLTEAMDDLDLLDDLVELQEGLMSLASEYESFHSGLLTYTDGVHELASSYNEIDQGVTGLADGAAALYDGASELHDGTKELHEETSDLPSQMQSEIDKFMEDFDYSNFDPTSFVSDKNENIGVVQFVLQTEEITMDDDEEEVEEKEEEKSLWQKFLDLFR